MAQLDTQIPASAGRTGLTDTLKVALIGHGIQLSRTPEMHRREGAAQGLSYTYELRDSALGTDLTIAQMLDQAQDDGLRGVNITHPFKQAALAHLDQLSEAARAVQAVNTVVFRDGKRFGHNTDYWGFSEAFRRGLSNAPRGTVLLLGAGGAGGAVAHALCDLGVETLLIQDVQLERAEALAEVLRARGQKVRVSTEPGTAAASADGIVNASPVGMASLPGTPIPVDLLEPRHWVADIIYFPLETELLAAARARGCRTMDGSGMAVFQAVRAFELFTGIAPDPARMRATFDAIAPTPAGSPGT
jgi:shikimate dehydrogenase